MNIYYDKWLFRITKDNWLIWISYKYTFKMEQNENIDSFVIDENLIEI